MSRTSRLLELLITLQTKSRFTVNDLATEFGVSRRTMLRDLHALSEMGVPLWASPGRYGGYSLIRNRRLLPLSLSPDEAIGMVLSYEAFLQYAESPFSVQSLSAITKLRNALPPDVVADLDRIHQHVLVMERVRFQRAPYLSDLLQASIDRAHLDIRYDSTSGITERRIFPYGLFASGGLWYCACHDYRRNRDLFLRVDRVQSVELVPDQEPREAVPLRQLISRYYNQTDQSFLQVRARVTRTGARNLELETLFGETVLDGQKRGRLEASIPESEIDFFASRLLTMGADIVVESPPQLVQAIKQKAAAISALYLDAG